MRGIQTLLLASLAAAALSPSSMASPLDSGSWSHVARIANGDGGMFNGNGDLQSTYSFGTYSSLLQTNDFQIPFDVYDGMQILFITGDNLYWGQTSYAGLRSLIDAKAASFAPNITFNAGINGVEQVTTGNVLSRNGFAEDPWISLLGDHGSAVAGGWIIWGENNYSPSSPQHSALANAHNGINVFVTTPPLETPLPAALPLFATVLAGAGFLTWRKRRKTTRVV